MQINRLSCTSGHVFEVKKMAKSKKSISFGQKLDIITDIEKGETQASMVHEGHVTQNDSEETGKDYDEPVQCPTVSEYYLALDVVKRFITCNGENPHLQAFSCLDDLSHSVQRKSKKQTKITEFMN